MKIKTINKINYTGDVYNLRIKSDDDLNHNYIANNACVANCHKAAATSIKTIMSNLWHCNYKFGVSGTLPKDNTADYLTIISQTGPIVNNINADTLIQEGFITPVNIYVLKMDYLDKTTKESFYTLSKKLEATELYQKEKKFVANNPKRLDYVSSIIAKSKKNSLVLFHLIDHGKALYEKLKKLRKKNVYYIDGKIKPEDRELYKKCMEQDRTKTTYTFETDKGVVKFLKNNKVLLSNGKYKKAKDIAEGDDIDDWFLLKYIK